MSTPETIEEAIEMLDNSIVCQQISLRELKKQKTALKKQKIKQDKQPHGEHSDCNDEEMAYYAAVQVIYDANIALNNSIIFGQSVYNTWQECLNS